MSLLKWSTITFCYCLLMLFSSFSSAATIYINNLEWPPFFFSDRTEGKIGLGKEIIEICLQRTNHQVIYKTLPIKRTHLYMQTGELDISVYSYKPERNEIVYFAKEPLFVSSYGLVSNKSKNLSITQLDDLDKLVIGHLSGLAHTPELLAMIESKKLKHEVTIGHSLEAMFSQLLATPQRFDVMPNSKETLKWHAKKLEIKDKVTIHDLVIAEKNYFIAVSKFSKNIADPKEFLQQLDLCILDLKATGEHQRISQKYGLE